MWPEHSNALTIFLRCITQWRSCGSRIIGLDYGVVLEIMRLYSIPLPAEVLEDLQIIEDKAVELLNKKVKTE